LPLYLQAQWRSG